MIKKNGDRITTSIILTKALKEDAERDAKRLGLNLSAYTRMAITERVEKSKKEGAEKK